MIRNYFLINIILLVIIGFLWAKFYKVYSQTFEIPSETTVKPIQKKTDQVNSNETVPSAARFQIISDMDLFRPSRTPYKEEVKQQEVPRVPPRLFGTIILGNEKTAILEDPNTKLTRMYHINESIGGYVVSDIFEEKVVLSWDGEKSEVRLREEKKGLAPVRPMAVAPPPQPLQRAQPQMPPQQQQIQPQMPTPPVQRRMPIQRPVTRRRLPRNLAGE
jgi:hypothetical protein